MLLLAQRALPGQIEAATVDHKLRPEAAIEAAFCAQLCQDLHVPHIICEVSAPLRGNIQSAARMARYALLLSWAETQRLDYILTAHHADDQAETFLMRLKRGVGVSGLAGVRVKNGAILRPLLSWRRAELADIVNQAAIQPVQDPSNHNDHYDRVKIRKALAAMPDQQAPWFDPSAISKTARHLADADEALNWAATYHAQVLLTYDAIGLHIAGPYVDLPHELQRRILVRALGQLDPALTLRGDALDGVLHAIRNDGQTMIGNWLITPSPASRTATTGEPKTGGGWSISPAPPRRSL